MQGCTIPGCQVTMVTQFCMVVLNIFGFCLQNLPHIKLLMLKFWGGSYSSGKFVFPWVTVSYTAIVNEISIIPGYCTLSLGDSCLNMWWYSSIVFSGQISTADMMQCHTPDEQRWNAALQKPKSHAAVVMMYTHTHTSPTEATCSHLFQHFS